MPVGSTYFIRLIASVLLIISGEHAFAGVPSDVDVATVTTKIHSLTENVVQHLIAEAFIPSIKKNKPEYRNVFDQVSVIIHDDARPFARAEIQDGVRTINISSGVAFIVLLYSEYAIIRRDYPDKHNAQCKNYIEFLGSKYRPGMSYRTLLADPYLHAPAFCGLPELLNIKDFTSKVAQLSYDDKLYVAVFGIMLGHEYGHHLLGHLPPRDLIPAESRKIEKEADYFASNLLGGYAPRTFGALIFDFLSKYREKHPFDKDRRHPAAQCRFWSLAADDTRYFGGLAGVYLQEALMARVDLMEQYVDAVQAIGLEGFGDSSRSRCDESDTARVNSKKVALVGECIRQNMALGKLARPHLLAFMRLEELEGTIEEKRKVGCPTIFKLKEINDMSDALQRRCLASENKKVTSEIDDQAKLLIKSLAEQCAKVMKK